MATKELKILITGSSKKLVSATKKAGLGLRKLGTVAAAVSAKIKGFFAGMAGALLSGPLAAFIGLTAAIVGVTKSLKAYAIQQAAVNRLGASIRKQGGDAKALGEEFQKTATALQRLTTIGDEDILKSMSKGLNLGVATDDIEKMTVAAIGLSRVIGSDVDTAMMLLARGQAGQMQMFTRYGITLDATKTKQEQFNDIMRISTDGFQLAAAETDDLAGKTEQFKNTFGDLLEEIGEGTVEMFNLADRTDFARFALEDLMDAFAGDDSASEWARNAAEGIGTLKGTLANIMDDLRTTAAFFGALSGGSSVGEALDIAGKAPAVAKDAKAQREKASRERFDKFKEERKARHLERLTELKARGASFRGAEADAKDAKDKASASYRADKAGGPTERGLSIGDLYGRNRKITTKRLTGRGEFGGFRTTSDELVKRMGGKSQMAMKSEKRLKAMQGMAGPALMDAESKKARALTNIEKTNQIIADNSKGVS